jgi:DNA-binding NarL/FixJ family response regulator
MPSKKTAPPEQQTQSFNPDAGPGKEEPHLQDRNDEESSNAVGTASDIPVVGIGGSALALVRELRPDVVLMDIGMPGMDGIQATRIIHQELPEVRIIGLSMFQEKEQQAAMRAAGAVDYMTKTGPSEALIEAIRACVRIKA